MSTTTMEYPITLDRDRHGLQWFEDRIGRTIYRDRGLCKCTVCANVFYNGLVIADSNHAWYVSMYEEIHIYRDTPYLALLTTSYPDHED